MFDIDHEIFGSPVPNLALDETTAVEPSHDNRHLDLVSSVAKDQLGMDDACARKLAARILCTIDRLQVDMRLRGTPSGSNQRPITVRG